MVILISLQPLSKGTYIGSKDTLGKPIGGGDIQYNNGDTFSGNFKNGKAWHSGNYITDDFEYDGNWNNNMAHGKGVCEYKKYGVYEGWFANGKREGFGRMEWSRGMWTYEGQWEDDHVNGEGTFKMENGDSITGKNWTDSKINGYGTMFYANGDRYDGNFVNANKDGSGTMHYASGKKHTGTWSKNRQIS